MISGIVAPFRWFSSDRTRSRFVLRADASAFGCFAGVADDFASFVLGFDLFVPLAASLASVEELASSTVI
jgi:hypothetical protein